MKTIKKSYVKPLMEAIPVNMQMALLAGSFNANITERVDEGDEIGDE